MAEEPILSVIVFSYNHQEYISTCLDSILRQQVDFSYEILLADDASSDNTVQTVLKQYGDKVKVLERKENLGLCKNMYDAFMQAKGKYIYECSGDDYLPVKHVFSKMVKYLEEHEDIFSVTGWNETYNVAKGTKVVGEAPYQEYTLLDFLRGEKVYFFMGMIRNTFKQDKPEYLCGGGKNNEEVQMWYYTLSKGKKVILPERMYTHCYRNTLTSGSYNATHNYLQMLEDYSQGFKVVENFVQKKYRFDIAKLRYYSSCIDYYLQNNGLRSVWNLFRVLGIGEMTNFIWIKFLMKLNHREIPTFLLRKDRLIR